MTATVPVQERAAVGEAGGPLRAFWLPVASLAARELVGFSRQPTRIVGALGQPLIFWILFGAGLGGTFKAPAWAPPGMTYQEYFLPGVAVLIVLFTAIFSTISIIEDRREGFLQGVLVAPINRASLVLGKLCGGALLAVVQTAIFLVIGPALRWVGLAPQISLALSLGQTAGLGLFLVLLAFELTAVGYLMAWPLDSTQGFHALMSVILMPMWLLSGAFFPVPESGWLAWVMRLNPLTYGVAGLQHILFGRAAGVGSASLPSLTTCIAVTSLFLGACFAASVFLTARRSVRNAR
jgi:ABC-2 type transport system permease protein